jgi:hypothetical protein
MHDHHRNLIDFHTQFSNVVDATEIGVRRSRARSDIRGRDKSQCRFGDTAEAADNWDKFRPKPTNNSDGGEPFYGSWSLGVGHIIYRRREL